MTIIKPLVTRELFADIACLNGQAFGVESFCNNCADIKMNACARKALAKKLIDNQVNTERELGYDLSVRYHYQDVMWDGSSRIELDHGVISAVNVIQTQDPINDGSPTTISPFVAMGVPVQVIDDSRVVEVELAFFENPSHAVIRKVTNRSVIEHDDTVFSFPRLNEDGDGWYIAIDDPTESISEVNVSHCKYIYAFVDENAVDLDQEIVAVHWDTEQYIPFVKPPFLYDGEAVFTFYAWSLVSPAFEGDDEINLKLGQFHKLASKIELLYLEDRYQTPIIIEDSSGECCNCPICPPSGKISVKIISDRIIEFSLSGCPMRCGPEAPMKIRIFYKTDPVMSPGNLGTIAEAIIFLTAAELPLKDCGCPEPKEGFIHMAQEEYGELKINQVIGSESTLVKYGSRHGQMVYQDYIRRVARKRAAIIA